MQTPNWVFRVAGLTLILYGSIALAQIEEVVVTAEKREVRLQEAPVSVGVYTADEIVRRGITDPTSLGDVDAALNVDWTTTDPILSIRGVSSGNTTEIGDPAVSIGYDGTFNNRTKALFGGFYDIERIEVLRGPQGTLYGRNATGGVVNIITARPSDSNEGQITGEFSKFDKSYFTGYGNWAVNDELQIRLSFMSRTREGYRSAYILQPGGVPSYIVKDGDERIASGRFQLQYQPSDELEIWFLAQYQDLGGQGPVEQVLPFEWAPGGRFGDEPLHEIPDGISKGADGWRIYAIPDLSVKSLDIRSNVRYTFAGGQTLVYVGGYQDMELAWRRPSYNGNNPRFSSDTPFTYNTERFPDTWNHEVRLESAEDQKFTWLLGAYYYNENSKVDAYTFYDGFSTAAANGVYFEMPRVETTSKAVFFHGGVPLSDKLTLSAGGRYTEDDKEREGTFNLFSAQTGLPFDLAFPFDGATSSDKFTWSVTLDYQMNPDNMIYFRTATGYKGGGFNNATSDYGPENNTSFELGSKNQFLDNRLQWNMALYYMDYTDQQVTQFVAGPTSSGSITVNAGESENYGFESDLIYSSGEFGTFELNLAYTHARYTQFEQSAGWNSSVNLDLKGNHLPFTPDWNVTARYERPIDLSGGSVLTPWAAVQYQSDKYFTSTNFPNLMQDAHALVDLGLDYNSPDGKYLVQAFVTNATDEIVFRGASEFYLSGYYDYQWIPPRNYGVRITMRID